MEKINVAELLKDCPKGMELDSTNYDGVVKFDGFNKDNPYAIRISVLYDGYVNIHSLTKYGQTSVSSYNKCVIFPKGKTTWEGFQRPFKDGDVLYVRTANQWICIYKEGGEKENVCHKYVAVTSLIFVRDDSALCHRNNIKEIRLATEEEKQKLFDAIKDNGYRWNAETKTLEEIVKPKFKVWDKIRHKDDKTVITITGIKDGYYFIQFYNVRRNDYQNEKVSFKDQDQYELVLNKFDIATLKPFSEVLVRYDNDNPWMIAHFSHYMKDVEWECPYFASGACFKQCIPYKGNEHLRGTTNDCDDFYKTWK